MPEKILHTVINHTFDVTMKGRENITHICYIKGKGCLGKHKHSAL